MDITAFDITILVASTVGIILMSLAFPALGLSGEEAQESEVPEFDITSDRFDIAGEFPAPPDEGPERSRSGTIYMNYANESNSEFILGDESHGWELETYNGSFEANEDSAVVELVHWYEGEGSEEPDNIEQNIVVLDNENDTGLLYSGPVYNNWGNVTVNVTAEEFQNQSDPGNTTTAVIGYTFDCGVCGEDSGGTLTNLPLVGGLFEAGAEVAGGVIWIAQILIWASVVGFELILNGLAVMVEVLAFMFGLADFLVGTYVDITTSDDIAAWASVILVIPGVMLMAVWAKLAAVAVEVIWIG